MVNMNNEHLLELEHRQSGYIGREEKKNRKGEEEKDRVGELVSSHNRGVVEEAKASGLDLAIELVVEDVAELERRLTGRKYDPVSQTLYHVQDSPAPSDIKGLQERLVSMDVTSLSINQALNTHKSQYAHFYSHFKNQNDSPIFHSFSNNTTKSLLF